MIDTHATLPPSWAAAIARIAEGGARRVVVVGGTDVGKSTFIRAAMTAASRAGIPLPLIDLDPGQKMIGAPGTAALGSGTGVERLVFIGSTSASELSRIVGAASLLAPASAGGFIAHTAGFVSGLDHQFGNFIPQLGDRRAVLLGEVVDPRGSRRDLQLKGAWRTMGFGERS